MKKALVIVLTLVAVLSVASAALADRGGIVELGGQSSVLSGR